MVTTPPIDPNAAWKAQKEQRKAAARAQREAWRAQKAYWRARRQPSLVAPVMLILIGVVSLLLLTGKIAAGQFWSWYSRWWPILLVAMGVCLLAEWFIDRNKPYPVRRSGSIVFLILLIVAFGWSASVWHNWGPLRDQIGNNDEDFFRFMGQEHDNDEQSSVTIPENAHIQVQNVRGDVTVAAVDGATSLGVRAHQIAYSYNDDDARRIFSSLAPKVTVSGSTVLVRVESANSGKADLTLEIPRSASIDVSTNRGDVIIAGCKGSVNVDSGHGDVKLDDIASSVHARMSRGDFSAHAVLGDLSLDGRMNDVTLSDIRGKVLLNGEFFGDTHLEHLAAPMHFHSSRTDIQLTRMDGDMTMDSGDLHINNVAGPLHISTRSKDIELNQIYGDVNVVNSNGGVTLAMAAPLGAVQVENRNGEVRLSVPASADFNVEAHATRGDIQTDFNSLRASGNDDKNSVLSGQVGKGGTSVRLNTTNNDIHVQKGESYPALPPKPPVPAVGNVPAPPAAPQAKGSKSEKSVKHLTAPKGEAPQTVQQ